MRRYIDVSQDRHTDEWKLALAYPTRCGHKFSHPAVERFKTKKKAVQVKRALMAKYTLDQIGHIFGPALVDIEHGCGEGSVLSEYLYGSPIQ
jgi:hypothetical protein